MASSCSAQSGKLCWPHESLSMESLKLVQFPSGQDFLSWEDSKYLDDEVFSKSDLNRLVQVFLPWEAEILKLCNPDDCVKNAGVAKA